MSVTLWLDTEREETIEIGATLPTYAAFAKMASAAGDAWFTDYPDLSGVLTQCESQEDADPTWLADVRKQAGQMLDRHASGIGDDAVQILQQLIGEEKPAPPLDKPSEQKPATI